VAGSLTAANIKPPADRILDGKNILPLLTSDAASPHEYLLSFGGATLKTVRRGKWKLHVSQPGRNKEKIWRPDEKWIDPRAPDGVTILAPYEQTHPSQFPGLLTGDEVQGKQLALFDLEVDPGEQHNVAADHPEIVQRLKNYADTFKANLKK